VGVASGLRRVLPRAVVAAADATRTRVCLGAIAGAHGVRGLVRIKSFTEAPEDLSAYGPLSDEAGRRRFDVTVKSQAKGALIAAIAGVDDRDAAEALKGTRLYVDRAALPPTEEEEFYHADLIGLNAEDRSGKAIGRVAGVQNYGAGDILEIARTDGTELLVPFTKAAVPEVDLAGGRLVVDPPAQETEAGPEE
jgi:16S rRNA processing protein RimM